MGVIYGATGAVERQLTVFNWSGSGIGNLNSMGTVGRYQSVVPFKYRREGEKGTVSNDGPCVIVLMCKGVVLAFAFGGAKPKHTRFLKARPREAPGPDVGASFTLRQYGRR